MPEEYNKLIVHLCREAEWKAAQSKGEYTAESLASEGFIHCSRPEQVERVANLYFAGLGNVVMLWLKPEAIRARVQNDPVGTDFYPHIYGPINVDAVVGVTPIRADADGVYRQIPSL